MAAPLVTIFEAGDYDAEVQRAADVLRGGGIVVLPTETVYGAAAALGSEPARKRLRSRRSGGAGGEPRPLIPHLAGRDEAWAYIEPEAGETARRLMRKLWPGPVGLIFDVSAPRRSEVSRALGIDEAELYSSHGQITLRCPDHVVATDIIGRTAAPVAVAAIDEPDPAQAAQAPNGQVDLVIDAGPTRYSKPSTLLKVERDGYRIVRAGVYDARIIERLLRTTVLFVCSGNTCRSPMCEALARAELAQMLGAAESDLEQKGYSLVSAGTFATPGARATPQAVEALAAMGLELGRHRSRPLSVELIHQADAIFTMGRNHAGAVAALVPSAAEKTVPLDPAGDIEDPIGADVSHYQALAVRLRELVAQRLREKVPV